MFSFEWLLFALWVTTGILIVGLAFWNNAQTYKRFKMGKIKTLLLEDYPHECSICDATYHELLDLMAHLKEDHDIK